MLLTFVFSQITAFAKDEISLTINAQVEDEPVAYAQFDLYEFAHYDNTGHINVTDDFADYAVDFESMTEKNWQDYVDTIYVYALRDNLVPQCSGVTNEDGILVFNETNSDITEAIYLVIGHTASQGNLTYSFTPFIVSVPVAQENGSYDYSQIISPKIEIHSDDIPLSSEIKVVKIWDDKDDTSKRPDSIEVQLLMDGEIYDTQTLTKDNNWRYTWSDLDPGVTWNVVEKTVPSGYTVLLDSEGNDFTITNTLKTTTTTTTTTSTTTPNETTTTSKIQTTTPTTTTKTDEVLPKTGLYWAPVPILLIVGIALVFLGISKNKSGDKKYEEK
jgi:hypothetical protein